MAHRGRNRRWPGRLAVGAIVAVTVMAVTLGGLLQVAMEAISSLVDKPTQVTALHAFAAASQCNFAGDPRLGTAYLVALAATTTFDPVQHRFGGYRNPFGDVGAIPSDIAAAIDRGALKAGGRTYAELGLSGGDLRPEEWTTIVGDQLLGGERGIGFLLVKPSAWRRWVGEVPGGRPETLDPYSPGDSMRVMACHLLKLEAGFGGGATYVVDAIQALGEEALQFADVAAAALHLAAAHLGDPVALAGDAAAVAAAIAKAMAGLSSRGQALLDRVNLEISGNLGANVGLAVGVGTPLIGGGVVPPLSFGMRAIPLPGFPADIDAHVNAGIGFRNQCVYGAFATWWLYFRQPGWPNSVGPPGSYAREMAATARAAGYTVVGYPVAGAMVVWRAGGPRGSWPGDDAGHIGTVIAVDSDRFEVIEQNVIHSEAFGATHWGTFDLRVSPWPDDHVLGFIVAPPGVPFQSGGPLQP